MKHLKIYDNFIHNLFLPSELKKFQKTIFNLIRSNFDGIFSNSVITNQTHTHIFSIYSKLPYNERAISIYWNFKKRTNAILFANTGYVSSSFEIIQDFLIYILTPFSFDEKYIKIKLNKLKDATTVINQKNFDLYKNTKEYNL